AKKSDWVTASDFNPSVIASLKPQEEHQLLLKSLSKKDSHFLTGVFFLELVAKSFGNEFFGLVADKTANRENTAIAKAAFKCLAKLQLQERVANVLELATNDGVAYLNGTGDLSKAFSRVCSKIDEELVSETVYTRIKTEYKKSKSWLPKKTYLYGIAKSEDDLREIFAQLVNDPQMKKISAHLTWLGFFSHPDDVAVKKSVSELARVPGKLEVVQKIYEKSISEMIPQIEDVPLDKIDTSGTPVQMNLSYLVPIFSQKLLENIQADDDLKSVFEPILKRNRDQSN
ncbi:unnamed protein product, partial [Ilex paraguariensis]